MSITPKQLDLLHHTLGLTPDRREPFRNHFVASEGHHAMDELKALEAAGLMARSPTPKFCNADDMVFHVTDAGRAYALDNLPQPPKRTNYDDYQHSESSLTFAEWLGIEVPRVEWNYSWGSECRHRYVRRDWQYRIDVAGEWEPTKKAAKASYKAALAASRGSAVPA